MMILMRVRAARAHACKKAKAARYAHDAGGTMRRTKDKKVCIKNLICARMRAKEAKEEDMRA